MIYVVCGPTASGKTNLAHWIFDHLDNFPIILNADAYQIYKGLDTLSAKVSKGSKYYKHYKMIDIVDVDECFSVYQYQKMARSIIDDAIKNNKDVIVVGGTGLYIRALFYDYEFYEHEKTIDLSEYEKFSNAELYELLQQLDYDESLKMHPNNRKRVIRTLALIREMKMSKTEYVGKQEHKIIYDDVQFICLNPDRILLYFKINDRVDEMINCGLINEIDNLRKTHNFSLTSINAIGVKETLQFLDNNITMEELKETIKQKTRRYAKRQITFFKHQLPCIMYNDISEFKKSFINLKKE